MNNKKNEYIKKYSAPYYLELKEKNSNKKEIGIELKEVLTSFELVVSNVIENYSSKQDDAANTINCDSDLFKKGNRHLLNIIINDISNFFKKLDFEFLSGNEVTTEVWNFDNLNITKNHVARNMHDTFFINNINVLRTHCTATTSMILYKNKSEDIRVFSYGNVYRKDEDDATHSHQFTQIDFVWLRKDFSLANLKWIINSFIKYIFGNELDVRYRLSYFPFTEPSFEVDVECWKCKKSGCNICKGSGWIEILGAGMLHQNVLKSAGIKNINSGLAGGIGVERIAMLKYGIKDIRDLYNNDFDINIQFKK